MNLSMVPTVQGATHQVVRGLTPTGAAVVVRFPSPKKGSELVLQNQAVGLIANENFLPIPRPANDDRRMPRQVVSANADDRLVVWMESPSVELGWEDWRVYSYDTLKKKSVMLADFTEVVPEERIPAVPGWTVPTVGDGIVYWASAYHPTANSWGVQILAHNADGSGRLRAVATPGKLPVADGQSLYFVRSADVDPGMAPTRFEIHRIAQDVDSLVYTGAKDENAVVSTLDAHDGTLAWILASNWESGAPGEVSTLFVLDRKEGLHRIPLASQGGSSVVCVSDRTIVWGGGSAPGDPGQYVLDRASWKVWRLGEFEGLSEAFCNDDFIAWGVPDSGKTRIGAYAVARWVGPS